MAENKKVVSNNRKLPYSIEAERSVFGCIFLNGENALEIMSVLAVDDFFIDSHKIVYSAISELVRTNRAVDIVTVNELLTRQDNLSRVGGINYLAELSLAVPSAAAMKNYVEIVRRMSVMRQLIAACADITEQSYVATDTTELLSAAEKKIFDIGKKSATEGLQQLIDTLSVVYGELNELNRNPASFTGIKTGFWKLDNITSGFQPGQLVVIAARPAVGKSSFVLNIIENALKLNKTCALFSLEMPKDQIAKRLICSYAGVSMTHMTPDGIKNIDWAKTYDAVKVLSHHKLYIDDSAALTPSDILSRCRRLKNRSGLDLVAVDYLQLMSSGGRSDSRQQEVSEISRNLKIIAKELGVPVLALSQLSRQIENRVNSEPQLSDLRDSGAIEQDADIVMFLHNDKAEGETNMRKLIIAKHRNGATGTIPLTWIGELVKFQSYSITETERFEQTQRNQARLAEETKKNKDAKKLAKVQEPKAFESDITEPSGNYSDESKRAEVIKNFTEAAKATYTEKIDGDNYEDIEDVFNREINLARKSDINED